MSRRSQNIWEPKAANPNSGPALVYRKIETEANCAVCGKRRNVQHLAHDRDPATHERRKVCRGCIGRTAA